MSSTIGMSLEDNVGTVVGDFEDDASEDECVFKECAGVNKGAQPYFGTPGRGECESGH